MIICLGDSKGMSGHPSGSQVVREKRTLFGVFLCSDETFQNGQLSQFLNVDTYYVKLLLYFKTFEI
jgi:hypothetical protein